MKTFTGDRSRLMTRIVTALHAGHRGDLHELAQRCISSPGNMEHYINKLRELGLARIVDWRRQPGAGSTWRAVWGFGEGLPDTPRPAARGSLAKTGDISGSERGQRIMDYLAARPSTAPEIGQALGLSKNYTYLILRAAHRIGLVHVTGWQRAHYGMALKRYAAGPGKDAPTPKPIPRKTINRNRHRRLIDQFGADIAKRIMASRAEGGPDVVAVDGRAIYRRGKPRGKTATRTEQTA